MCTYATPCGGLRVLTYRAPPLPDAQEAFEEDDGHNLRVRAGATEGSYKATLRPGDMLSSLLSEWSQQQPAIVRQ